MKHEAHNLSREHISEVELSADELVGLARAADRALALQHAVAASSQLADDAISVAIRGVPAPASRSWTQRLSRAPVFGVLGLAVVASIAVAAHYEYAGSKRVVQAPPIEWTPLPERPVEPIEVAEAAAEAPPTLYRNPFDKNEVFELPPGLTQDEARDMVAQLLLERARERVARKR
jgi:hypothetical protein